MIVSVNTISFTKDMKNIIDYSIGFLDGAKKGEKTFLNFLGKETIEILKKYLDTMARVDPEVMQHMYEWNQVGSPEARLFDISYVAVSGGISIGSSFKQSMSIKNGSRQPFYDKARIMEEGIPVTIKPTRAKALVFEANGETVFTKNPVQVDFPGGPSARGGFEKTIDSFFNSYFSQAFLRSSGIADYLERATLYKKNFSAAKRGGKSLGIETGFKWIATAGVMANGTK